MKRTVRGKWPVQHQLCHFSRSGLNVRSPSASSALTGIFLPWLIILSNPFTQPPWHRSQGSNHSKGNSLSSHRGRQVLQKGEKRRGKRGSSFKPEVRVTAPEGQKCFKAHSIRAKECSPSNVQNEANTITKSSALSSPMSEWDFHAGCRQPETHLTHLQSSVRAKLRTSAFFFCTKIWDRESQKTRSDGDCSSGSGQDPSSKSHCLLTDT